MKESIKQFLEQHGLGKAAEILHRVLNAKFLENSVADYGLATVLLVALILILSIVKKLSLAKLQQFAKKTATDFDDMFVEALAKIKSPAIITTSLYISTLSLKLTPALASVIKYALVFILTIQAVEILQIILSYGIRKTYRSTRPNDLAYEVTVKNITFAVRWGLWILAVIFILDNLGINITTLVAGLGIGGIAVAMASQAILGDAFSALSIFFDKPFEIGDFIIVDDLMGTVEHVGIKTTKIRSLSGEQLIFANSDLTKSRIKNYKRMDTRRIAFKFGVIYQTPNEKLKAIPKIIKDIFAKTAGARLDRVHFQSFGDSALIFEVVYYVLSADYNFYMDKQELINFSLKETFEKEGIEFAYPTQTVYEIKAAPRI